MSFYGWLKNGNERIKYTWLPHSSGVLLIHASAVIVNNHGFIFLGPSGTGKSTICSILESETIKIADDRVCLIPNQGSWAISSADDYNFTDRISEEQVVKMEKHPLKGILRLYRGTQPKTIPTPSFQTFQNLFVSYFEFKLHVCCSLKDRKNVFSTLASIARAVRGYSFYFNCSFFTVQVFNEMLNQDFSLGAQHKAIITI